MSLSLLYNKPLAMKMEHYLGHTDSLLYGSYRKGKCPQYKSPTNTNGQYRDYLHISYSVTREFLLSAKERLSKKMQGLITSLIVLYQRPFNSKIHKLWRKPLMLKICEKLSNLDLVAMIDLKDVDKYNSLSRAQFESFSISNSLRRIVTKIAAKFYKKTGRKLQFDAKEPVGFDKTKVSASLPNTSHFTRDYCGSKGNQESKRASVETRKEGNTGYKDYLLSSMGEYAENSGGTIKSFSSNSIKGMELIGLRS
ncbi:hypothetical protein Tco_1493808 [Tanacetum coccineum]